MAGLGHPDCPVHQVRDEASAPVGRNQGFDRPTNGHKDGELTVSDSPSALGGRFAVSMGPRSDVEAAHSESSQGVHSRQEVEPTPQIDGTLRSSGGNLRIADWLFRSSAASLIWLVVRVVTRLLVDKRRLSKDLGLRKVSLLVRWRRGRQGLRGGRSCRIGDRQGRSQLRLVGRVPSQLRHP